MKNEVNHQYFEKEAVENGLHISFINELLKQGFESSNYFNDIHIYPEEDAVIIEWQHVPYDRQWGGRFIYLDVDDGESVMIEREFPDRHYEYFHSEEEYNEALQDWLKENPGWEKNSYGHWYNKAENEALRKEFERERAERAESSSEENKEFSGEEDKESFSVEDK